MNLPIKSRLVLWYVTLFAVIVSFWSVFVVVLVHFDLYAGIDRALASRASQIALSVRSSPDGKLQDVSDSTLAGIPQAEATSQLLLIDGTVLEHTGDAVSARPMADTAVLRAAAESHSARLETVLTSGERFRLLIVPIPGTDRLILVGQSTETTDSSLRRLIFVMFLTGPVALLAAGAGGWFLAGRALRPVAQMAETAAAIGIDRLDERVPMPPGKDELTALAETLNRMLSRLEAGVRDKRRLVADASHELQTPLAVMRAELDVTLAAGGLPPAAVEVLESTREEADRMTRIVRNLMTLARFDDGNLRLLKQPMDLHLVATESALSLSELARENGATLRVDGQSVMASADPEYVRLIAANLVENAIKYSGHGATVRVEVATIDGAACLSVVDDGPGVPISAIPHLFERFYRADASRSTEGGGSGLGLAIVKEIVEAHRGRVTFENQLDRGARFTVWLPSSSGSTRDT